MKKLILLALLLTACQSKTRWEVDQRPETDNERVAVGVMVMELIHQGAWTSEADRTARRTICQRRLYQIVDGRETGEMRELP